MFRRYRGFTIIEISIAMAIIGIAGMGGVMFFRNTFTVWHITRDASKAAADSRAVLNEISTYVRQADSDTINIKSASSIYFDIERDAGEWAEGTRMGYFKEGAAMKRYMRGSTTTVVNAGIESFSVEHITATADSRAHIDINVTVRQGNEMADMSLNKKIMLRGGRSVQ